MTEMTAAGAEARSIMRWAWQDPEARAVDGLEQVNELAARAESEQALMEIKDAGQMLARLVSSVNGGGQARPDLISSQLARPQLLSEQVDLAAIHGHHIPGTQYTYRHGWVPVIGKQLVDKYPEYVVKGRLGLTPQTTAKEAKKADLQGEPPDASKRVLTPEQKAMVARNKQKLAAAARAASPSAPTPYRPAGAAPKVPAPAQSLKPAAMMKVTGPPMASAPAAPAAADPLASLASPGADMAALKAYVDARVAAEVARQVGQITQKQHDEVQDKLAKVHRSQQKLIAFVRKQTKEGHTEENKHIRSKLLLDQLFNFGGLAVALGGVQFGLSPVHAALAAAIAPTIGIITNYAKRMG